MKTTLISLFQYDNFAVRLLFSHLRANGIDVSFIGFKRMRHKVTQTLKNEFMEMNDYHTEVTEEDVQVLLQELERIQPDLIGIGLQSSHFPVAKRITQAIKARMKVPVIWGGAHPTIDPENCIEHTDMLCVGEGAEALLELVQCMEQGRSYSHVQNLWINKDGRVIRNPTRPLLADLDILPCASYDSGNKTYIDDGQLQPKKNIDYFGYGFTDNPSKTIHQTMTSFGCPMECSFCMNALTDNRFRRRSVAHVIAELVEARLRNRHLKMVFFWDNIFHVNKRWCLEFAKEYSEKVKLPFFAYSHPLFMEKETLMAVRRAGWVVTVMGVQSGSHHFRVETYGRRETNAQVLEAARRLDALRKVKNLRNVFRIYYDYVKDNPLEGKAELKEGLDLMLKFPKNFIFQAFNLSFFPNYIITKRYLEKGLISEKDIEGRKDTSGSNWITTFNAQKEYPGFLRMHEYYYLLCSLAQFKIFPNDWIRRMEKKEMFYNRLSLLYWLCRVVRFVDLYFRPSNYLWLWAIMNIVSIKNKFKYGTLFRHK